MAALTLVDTSAWVEFLRRTGSAADLALDERQRHDPGSVTMAPPIAMELLLGSTDELAVRRIERLVASVPSLDVVPELDFGAAATLYRAARRSGRAPRSTVDCLIAAIAIRHDAVLLHQDADYEAIADVSSLRQHSLRQ